MSANRFTAELAAIDVPNRTEDGLIVFSVDVVGGQLDGTTAEAGVALDELASWPLIHPHWLHLPSHIHFPQTNAQPSPKPGWTRHSRSQATPSSAARSAADWLAHVRGILTEAIFA